MARGGGGGWPEPRAPWPPPAGLLLLLALLPPLLPQAAPVQPELVQLEAAPCSEGEEEEEDPGALGLVQAHPPATITWVDQDGRTMVNTSLFLIAEARTYPRPTDHTVRLRLRSLAHNRSLRDPGGHGGQRPPSPAARSPGRPARAAPPGAGGGGRPEPVPGLPPGLPGLPEGQEGRRDSSNLKPRGLPRVPRASISLPANLQLNDLTGQEKRAGDAPVEGEEERALSEPENSLVLVERGLGRFPMVGYIYRASSMSSDEIWL